MSTPHAQPNPMDPMLSFWKEAWARMAVAAPAGGMPGTAGTAAPDGTASIPGFAPGVDPLGWMPTPDMLRRMQSAFLDTMASASEQYMRSPQFLDQMKQSFDAALEMRRQMEEMVRRGATGLVSGDPLTTPGQVSADLLAGLRGMESRLNARLDDLATRIASLESGAAREQPRPVSSASTSQSPSQAPSQDGAGTTTPKGGSRAPGGASPTKS